MSSKKDSEKIIFVLDDDPSILDVMTIVLSEQGCEVVSVPNEADFFEALKKKTPDLIFLDLWISGSHGKEITKKLKQNKDTAKIPVIIVSALNETEAISKEVGADGFLEKPFEIEYLLKMVKSFT